MKIDCSCQEDFSGNFEVTFEKEADESAWGARKRKRAEKVLSSECAGGSAWACVARQVCVRAVLHRTALEARWIVTELFTVTP